MASQVVLNNTTNHHHDINTTPNNSIINNNNNNNNNDDGSSWILVSSRKKKKKPTKNKEVEEERAKLVLSQSQHDALNPLNRAVYEILRDHAYLIPASYITKLVNSRGLTTDAGAAYTKKDIGQVLYAGPLRPYLFRYAKKHPTLWGLRYADHLEA
jgi:hypothetical protein